MPKTVELDVKVFIILVAITILATVGSSYLTYVIFATVPPTTETNGEDSAAAEEVADIGPTFDLGTFTVNLRPEAGYRGGFIRVSVVVEVDRRNTLQEIEKRLPQVKDKVIETLLGRSPAEVASSEALAVLRRVMAQGISELLPEGRVVNVYFTELVVQ